MRRRESAKLSRRSACSKPTPSLDAQRPETNGSLLSGDDLVVMWPCTATCQKSTPFSFLRFGASAKPDITHNGLSRPNNGAGADYHFLTRHPTDAQKKGPVAGAFRLLQDWMQGLHHAAHSTHSTHAATVAGLMITTEAMVAELPKDEAPAAVAWVEWAAWMA